MRVRTLTTGRRNSRAKEGGRCVESHIMTLHMVHEEDWTGKQVLGQA
jgi:hypothetical protein